MTDAILDRYRHSVTRAMRQRLPDFAPEARHTAPILAILETPGPGAKRSGHCGLDNSDPTAKRIARLVEESGIQRRDIVFWNLYAAYEAGHTRRTKWAKHLSDLINLMPNLQVVIAFGDHAWRGLRDVELPQKIWLIGAPHPSNQSCNRNREATRLISRAWLRAKLCITAHSRPTRR